MVMVNMRMVNAAAILIGMALNAKYRLINAKLPTAMATEYARAENGNLFKLIPRVYAFFKE
jgi:hypothetical protein